jgi:hypothetical protein|tara:strand:+ start:91 stop:225 length:135 start_codon:yes stop_codon:yes gene_type:complete
MKKPMKKSLGLNKQTGGATKKKGLTAAQKKLPPALQAAILKKMK